MSLKVLISEEEIQKKVEDLAKQIDDYYKNIHFI